MSRMQLKKDEELLKWKAKKIILNRNEHSKNFEIKKVKQRSLSSTKNLIPKLCFDNYDNGKEVLVKITSNSKSFEGLKKHIDYISRNGKLELIDSEMMIFKGNIENKDCLDNYQNLGNPIPVEKEIIKTKRETYNIVFSMKDFKNCPPEKLKSAAYKTIKTLYPNNYFVLALHTDTDNPHCHICLKVSNNYFKKLDIKKSDLFRMRENFASNLKELNIDASATKLKFRHRNASLDLTTLNNKYSNIKPHYYQVIDFGKAPYKDISTNKDSYFISYLTPKGITKIWGNDLERIVLESKLQKGEYAKFAKIGNRLQKEVFNKKIKNKTYEIQSERKIAVWDISILNRAEKQFTKLLPVEATYKMKEIKNLQFYQNKGEKNGKQRYTKEQWARFYASVRAKQQPRNNIYKPNAHITTDKSQSINDLPTLSQISLVSKQQNDQVFLSSYAQHKLSNRADTGRSDKKL